MKRAFVSVILTAFVVAVGAGVVGAQGAKSANDGVYSAAQAKRGATLYNDKCAACHGDNLEGTGPMPPLAGQDFLNNWTGKSLGDLFEKTNTTMPATAPGSLSAAETADLIAHLLNRSKYKEGTAELASTVDALMPIKLDAPK